LHFFSLDFCNVKLYGIPIFAKIHFMPAKPFIPKGTRDFGPVEIQRRHFIMEHIRSVFESYGFQPIETPSFENLTTLLGKYGDEGDRLIFKILNNGDYLSRFRDSDESVTDTDLHKVTEEISKRGLRYDLTVPFARYVVMHQSEFSLPFKRYQIQPVWRADRPQKGRYQEFYQCDADVVGSKSLLQEVDFIHIYDEVFDRFGLEVEIRINHRGLLTALSELIESPDKVVDLTVALDKLDKIGRDGVENECRVRGISEEAIQRLAPLFDMPREFAAQFDILETMLGTYSSGREALKEMRFLFDTAVNLGLRRATLRWDVTLARGLNYYTGPIFEVVSKEVELGSIGGGGRYDDLTSVFGGKEMPGVGISFGLDRIYLVLEELDRFPDTVAHNTDLLFVNFGDDEVVQCLRWAQEMRAQGIRCEVYPESAKMKKQMSYADRKGIPFVAVLGSREIERGRMALKDMRTGEQSEATPAEAIARIQEKMI